MRATPFIGGCGAVRLYLGDADRLKHAVCAQHAISAVNPNRRPRKNKGNKSRGLDVRSVTLDCWHRAARLSDSRHRQCSAQLCMMIRC